VWALTSEFLVTQEIVPRIRLGCGEASEVIIYETAEGAAYRDNF
jgi:hypothetical protein